MQMQEKTVQEAAEDLFFGQIVIIWARWFVVIAATSLIILSSSDIRTLVTAVPFVAVLIAVNFFVHGRYLMNQPVNQTLLTLLSVVDLIVITMLVLFWGDDIGFASQLYVYYYPVILAFAFVFSFRRTAVYTLVAMAGYLAACLIPELFEPTWLPNWPDVERMVLRLIIMATMGGLGTFYWRIQRSRRQEVAGGPVAEMRT